MANPGEITELPSLEGIVPKDNIFRGEFYYADLSPVLGSEQGGKRPVLVIQNNIGNAHSPTIIVASVTSIFSKAKIPTHIEVKQGMFGLPKNSILLLEQLRTIDKRRLREKIGQISPEYQAKVDNALKISLGLKII